ncbi:MAG: zinc ribbon domain-containing protein [Verrucomicrobiaceae bacterium]|nr:MAG: zinc ribbon domain-containing protein [Verrucomicrobiaceae bacterium]
MSFVLYPFLALSTIGLVLSIGAHVMALTGIPLPSGKLVWGLHAGIFVVWLPAVLISMQTTRHASRKDFWKVALAGCPIWMRRGFYVLFGYAILNFVVLAATTGRQPKQPSDSTRPFVVRIFSGHWMVFYGAAFAILYSRLHAPDLYRERKCPNGHAVSPTARFCSECGYDFTNKVERG